jgi:protein phosphatase
LLSRIVRRAANAEAFTAAYRRYCWPTDGLDGVTIAPFQLLAAGGVAGGGSRGAAGGASSGAAGRGSRGASGAAAFHDRPHAWHLALADRLVAADSGLVAPTRRLAVDCADPSSVAAGVSWWEELTGAGGEGMVVKPAANLVTGPLGVIQPGLKVRGREYLRIIYGPDYTEPAHLDRLRRRGLGHKRSLAAREYALGIEGLERAASGEPLWRIHECVFAVLACESEPVDPRL